MSLVFFALAMEIVTQLLQLPQQPQHQLYRAQINATTNLNLVMFNVKETPAVSKLVKLKMFRVYCVNAMAIVKQPQLQRRQQLQQQNLALITVMIILPNATPNVMAMNSAKNFVKMQIYFV